MFRLTFLALVFGVGLIVGAEEDFVGSFAEPRDGGNLDTARSSYDGETVVIVPRAHASEAIGGATRWRNVHFAVRGVRGKTPVFRLPLRSPGSGAMILTGDAISLEHIKLVWSYASNAARWNTFETHRRLGTGASSWRVEASNAEAFTEDVVYVSINERMPVGAFYDWLEKDVLTHRRVRSTPSETTPGSFVIGYQSGASASSAFSRAIPDMPLFGFAIREPSANPRKLVMLVSGQHPYEGQAKVALQGAVDWILNSETPEAIAYRAEYVTLVYPMVNPTGELAGLWRGTAQDPTKDVNRHWHTTETEPGRARGIDTVIVHKNAMNADIAGLALGEPYAVFDYHQNFGECAHELDYVLHASPSEAEVAPAARRVAATEGAAYFARLSAGVQLAGRPSDLATQQTLRGYMVARGVKLPVTFERSVYNTLASERAFGGETVRALADPVIVAGVRASAGLPGLLANREVEEAAEGGEPLAALATPTVGSGE